jgi:HEAT repeat protein
LVLAEDNIGSGALIDSSHRLVLTNEHVVEKATQTAVFFPAFDGAREVISDFKHYLGQKQELGIPGKVLAVSKSQDLALIQLERLPTDVRPVRVVKQPARTGAKIYSIGNSGVNEDLLWRLTSGTVRGRKRLEIEKQSYTSLETDAPTNKGDSGGPVVNAQGELVAVVVAYNTRERAVSENIDAAEVRDFVRSHFQRAGGTWAEPQAPPPTPDPQLDKIFANLIDVLKNGAPAHQIEAARRLGKLGVRAKAAVPLMLSTLEKAEPDLAAVLTASLVQIGAPEKGAESVLIPALKSKYTAAKLYAATHLASGQPLPAEGVSAVCDALNDASADVRAYAARALGNTGPRVRAVALGQLLDCLGDSDPSVRQATMNAIKAIGPAAAEDRAVIEKRLESSVPEVRIAALELLGTVASPQELLDILLPLLKSPDSRLRIAAVTTLSSVDEKKSVVAGNLLPLLADSEPAVRAAVVKACKNWKGVKGVAEGLTKRLDVETDPETLAELADSIMNHLDAEVSSVPLLRRFLKSKGTAIRESAALKLASIGQDASEAVPDLIKCIADAETGVRVAALKALAATGSHAKQAVSAAADLLDKDETSPLVLAAAIEVLAAGGPEGIRELETRTARPFPDAVRLQICVAFSQARTIPEKAIPWMIDQAETLADCRDIVTATLSKAADDNAVLLLLKRTEVYKTRKNGDPETKYPDDYRKWVLKTLRKIDLPKVARKDTQEAVKSRLRYMAQNDKIADVASEARAVLNKFGW